MEGQYTVLNMRIATRANPAQCAKYGGPPAHTPLVPDGSYARMIEWPRLTMR